MAIEEYRKKRMQEIASTLGHGSDDAGLPRDLCSQILRATTTPLVEAAALLYAPPDANILNWREDARIVKTESEIEHVTRADEERFLRGIIQSGERLCINGPQCLSAEWFGQSLVEYFTPAQLRKINVEGAKPVERQRCLLCVRQGIAEIFMRALADGAYVHPGINLCSNFCNIVGRTGEYLIDDCMFSPDNRYLGLVHPVVMNRRNCYYPTVRETSDGRERHFWLIQTYGKPESALDVHNQFIHPFRAGERVRGFHPLH